MAWVELLTDRGRGNGKGSAGGRRGRSEWRNRGVRREEGKKGEGCRERGEEGGREGWRLVEMRKLVLYNF